MYFNTDSNITDTSLYFDSDDFYNSSILLSLRNVGLFDFETDNLLREDLISYGAYTDHNNLGLFLLSQGETQDLIELKDSLNRTTLKVDYLIEPFTTIQLKDNKELAEKENKVTNSNTLTNFDLYNGDKATITEHHYVYDKDAGFVET